MRGEIFGRGGKGAPALAWVSPMTCQALPESIETIMRIYLFYRPRPLDRLYLLSLLLPKVYRRVMHMLALGTRTGAGRCFAMFGATMHLAAKMYQHDHSYSIPRKTHVELAKPLITTSLRRPIIIFNHRERDRFPTQHHTAYPPAPLSQRLPYQPIHPPIHLACSRRLSKRWRNPWLRLEPLPAACWSPTRTTKTARTFRDGRA